MVYNKNIYYLSKEDKTAWSSDEEFAREMLAGVNPVLIARLDEFPPKSTLDTNIYGDQTSKITEEHIKDGLDGLTVNEKIIHMLLMVLRFGQQSKHGRRFLPESGTPDYKELESNPEKAFLRTITSQLQALVGVSVIEILSRHSSDEVYLGQRSNPEWTLDKEALEAFEKFGEKLGEIEKKIAMRNKDPQLKNRVGPVDMPYTLLFPTSSEGLTGRGIPNSISI
uniref:Lipoxygenase domain-containing protein n=1 Tax=Cucumis sativus TaxID=3659 RepID=A0A0A0LGD0_CUCSA